MSETPNESSQISDETGIESNDQQPVSPEANEDISRRRALKLGGAGLLAAGVLALRGGRPDEAKAANGDPLVLGQVNHASGETRLNIDGDKTPLIGATFGDAVLMLVNKSEGYGMKVGNASSSATILVENNGQGVGLVAESDGWTGIVGSTNSRTSSAILGHAKTSAASILGENDGAGAGVSGESKDGHGVSGYAKTDGSGVIGTSKSGPGVQGTGNTTGPGVLAQNIAGGNALEVDGPSEFSGAAEFSGGQVKFTDTVNFDGGSTVFSSPVEFRGGVQLGALAGSATIPRGRTSVTVPNTAITNQSVIVLTPVGNPSANLPAMISSNFWYERKPGTGFVVYISLPPKQNLEFTYFIARV